MSRFSGKTAISINADIRFLLRFLCAHFIVWATVPALLKPTLHPDSIEAINWGIIGGWVADKHPPLSGFVSNLFFQIFGGSDVSIYILSQLFMLSTFVYVWRLANLIFRNGRKSLAAVMLLEGVFYYSVTAADQFNCNIISVTLWAAATYYLYKATHDGRVWDWAMFGLMVALATLDKYSVTFFLAGAAFYIFAAKEGREQIKRPGAYIAAAIMLVLLMPHIYWLIKSDFFMLQYARQYLTPQESWLTRFIEPFRFIAAQLLAAIGAVVIYFWCVRKDVREQRVNNDKVFILSLGLIPMLVIAVKGFIFNSHLATMWGIPTLYMTGIMLVFFFPVQISDESFASLRRGVYIFMVFIALVCSIRYVTTTSQRIRFDKLQFISEIEQKWVQNATGAPLAYVYGDTWATSIMSVYCPEHPHTILYVDKFYRREFTPEKLTANGIIIFTDRESLMGQRQAELGVSVPVNEYNFENKAWFGGRSKNYKMFYSIIPPDKKLR